KCTSSRIVLWSENYLPIIQCILLSVVVGVVGTRFRVPMNPKICRVEG
ncbi:hypothetical protein TNCT_494561, partial [Trichonephila clavata]